MKVLKDSRGRESKTLTFVAVTWVVMVFKFAIAGLEYNGVTAPPMDVQSFGIAVAAVLAIWLGREWKQKDIEAQNVKYPEFD
jgi:urea transporter